jgi:hypothetical protein
MVPKALKRKVSMKNIIQFPFEEPLKCPLPRKREFYIGYRYVGPPFCQDVQNLFLKRSRFKNGSRKWEIITYTKYDDADTRKYSIVLDQCKEQKLTEMIDDFCLGSKVTFQKLRDMGWQGRATQSAQLFSINHKCYKNILFPKFTRPLKGADFGLKVMAQGRGAEKLLNRKGLYAFTIYDFTVWINLEHTKGLGYKTVPVNLTGPIGKKFLNDNFFKNNLVKEIKK